MTQDTEYTQEPVDDDLVGAFLKCAKGVWSLDDEGIETGPDGFRLTILTPTAKHGRVKWENGRIVARVLHKYSEGDPSWEEMPDGWNAYTTFQGIAEDELLTFKSSSYGARRALKNVIAQYRFRGGRQFPICTLGKKQRKNDPNGNFDPVFRIRGWVPIGDFADILPEAADRRRLEAPPWSAPPSSDSGDDGYAGHDPANDLPL
jgi:hypothetical protein